MWMRRDTQDALVGCKADSPTRWVLKCVNRIWIGQVGICPAISSASSTGSGSELLSAHLSALIPKSTNAPIALRDDGKYNIYC